MKTIIVATDFSAAALNAANYAVDMAQAINAEILLLNMYQIPIQYTAEVPIVLDEEELKDEAKHYMQLLRQELIEKSHDKVIIKTQVELGIFFSGLIKVCKQINPYAVIIGSQGTTTVERLFFGGHTVYAMKHLLWPLISVPIGSSFSSIKKIGFACDFNKVAIETPIEEIVSLVKDFNAELHVFNVSTNDEYFDADAVFESSLLKAMLKPLNPIYEYVTSDDVVKEIMDFSEKQHIDLLVVVPKHRGIFEQLFSKGHTRQLALHCHVPIAAMHALDY